MAGCAPITHLLGGGICGAPTDTPTGADLPPQSALLLHN